MSVSKETFEFVQGIIEGGKNSNKPSIGDTVEIVIKPYVNKVYVIGKVKRVLTKK